MLQILVEVKTSDFIPSIANVVDVGSAFKSKQHFNHSNDVDAGRTFKSKPDINSVTYCIWEPRLLKISFRQRLQ
ncbi:hypothetical protein TSUD_45850 [Trifolium subterraneum]|nr:hypothetical protein TSUD_45850 [Trifolium subterraneum]